jgi:hypothetical protein
VPLRHLNMVCFTPLFTLEFTPVGGAFYSYPGCRLLLNLVESTPVSGAFYSYSGCRLLLHLAGKTLVWLVEQFFICLYTITITITEMT